MVTSFEDLPFELRYNIFRINTEKAFESKIKRFSRLYDKLCKPKMYAYDNNISGILNLIPIDKGVTIIITNDSIRYIYSGHRRMNNIFCYAEVEWSKNKNIWNIEPVIIISERHVFTIAVPLE